MSIDDTSDLVRKYEALIIQMDDLTDQIYLLTKSFYHSSSRERLKI